MKTLTIEQTPQEIQSLILLDDWIAYIPFKEPEFLFLVLRKAGTLWVSHIYNNQTEGYVYGTYHYHYEAAFTNFKERASEWANKSGYELGELIQIEGYYGNE